MRYSVVLTTLVKLLLKMSRKMGKKLKELGKTLSEGSPTLAMGFYSPRAFPRPIPFGNGTPGLIGWHPWPILVPGVLQSWENSFFPHHAAPLGFIRALPSHQTLPGRIPICGKPLFLPITRLPCLLGAPSHQLFPGGCSSVGNGPPGYSPFQLLILVALRPLPYLFLYVCTYL